MSPADNTRRVEPRNTPTVINAVFNYASFWDGRAHNLFNGVDAIGPLDPSARVWVADPLGLEAEQVTVRIPNSSLASQAVGPPTSNLEMAFFDRPFPLVGRKLFNVVPLGQQRVEPTDSVLGVYSRAVLGQDGLLVPYGQLVELAFQPIYWNAPLFRTPEGYTLMEANFSLFFGMAVQLYESTLVSDQTPFDRFMRGDDTALTQPQLQGLAAFLNRGRTPDGLSRNPPAVDALLAQYAQQGFPVGAGNCVSCHAGPELTRASVSAVTGSGRLALVQRAAPMGPSTSSTAAARTPWTVRRSRRRGARGWWTGRPTRSSRSASSGRSGATTGSSTSAPTTSTPWSATRAATTSGS